MDRWTGRLVVVTGASSGVGRSTVAELSKYPLKIVALAGTIGPVQKFVDKLQSCVAEIYPVHCDFTDESDILRAFEWIETTIGLGVSVIVNNIGTMVKTKILSGEKTDWKHIFDLHVLATTICCRESYNSMKKHNIFDGHVININSTADHTILLSQEEKVYNSAQTALLYLTEGFRHEVSRLGSKIKVTGISPGKVTDEAADGNVGENAGRTKPNILSMKPERVTSMIILALTSPPDVVIAELTVLSVSETVQSYPPSMF